MGRSILCRWFLLSFFLWSCAKGDFNPTQIEFECGPDKPCAEGFICSEGENLCVALPPDVTELADVGESLSDIRDDSGEGGGEGGGDGGGEGGGGGERWREGEGGGGTRTRGFNQVLDQRSEHVPA